LPNGKEVMPEGRNVLMNAPKGTKVLTHEQQIREMLNERGISMSKSYHSNGMTAQEMDGVMAKHFSKIQTNVTNIDKKGFSSWSEKNGNRTKQNANRVAGIGFKV
jgi:lambda repressor-like predicted transcriptional regulator